MISALVQHASLNGAGSTPAPSTRARLKSATEEVEASAVVTVSSQGASLAAAQSSVIPTVDQVDPTAAAAVQSRPAPQSAPVAAAPVNSAPASAAPAPAAASAATSTAQTEEEKVPAPISLVPNLIYAPADTDLNGVISATERRSFDLEHPELAEPRAPSPPPRQVVEAELREYTSVANTRF